MKSAIEILSRRKKSEPVLTIQFADRVNMVASGLPVDTTMYSLCQSTSGRPSRGCGDIWYDFVLSLSAQEKGMLTRSLLGVSFRKIGKDNPRRMTVG